MVRPSRSGCFSLLALLLPRKTLKLTVYIISTSWKFKLGAYFFHVLVIQPMEVFVDDETKLTLHGLQQYYCKLKDSEKNRKLFDLLDVLEFNQVRQFFQIKS